MITDTTPDHGDTRDALHRLLTPAEVDETLRVRRGWLYSQIHQRTCPLPIVRVGRYVRVRQADLEDYLDRQVERAAS